MTLFIDKSCTYRLFCFNYIVEYNIPLGYEATI